MIATTKKSALTAKKSGLDGKLLAYALAGGAFVGTQGVASAGVISYGGPEIVANPTSVEIDLDGDTVADFAIEGGYGTSGTIYNYLHALGANAFTGELAAGVAVNGGQAFAYTGSSNVLNQGDVSSQEKDEGTRLKYSVGNQSGAFPIDTSYFIGLSFEINGQTHYGWAEIYNDFYGIDNDGGYARTRLLNYAYNDTPGAGIDAGDTVGNAVPEPGSLALFALGAAGIALARRRRAA